MTVAIALKMIVTILLRVYMYCTGVSPSMVCV